MAAYISESFRHYNVAKKIRETMIEPPIVAYAIVSQCAFYVESVVNDVIFSWHMNRNHSFPNFELHEKLRECDQYNERLNINDKLLWIIHPTISEPNCTEKEYVEFKHLVSIRNSLVHLKPTEQLEDGKSNHKGPRKALNYLHQKKIIEDPFGRGVFWADVIDHKVSDWTFEVVNNLIVFMYDKTFYKPFGIQVLRWNCQLLGVGPFSKKLTTPST